MPISAVNRSTKARFSGGKFAFDHAEVKEAAAKIARRRARVAKRGAP
jgi:hypothetical protein